MVIVQAEPIDPAALLAEFTQTTPEAGGIVSFTGLVRPASQGEAVTALELQAYPGFTEKVIAELVDEARGRFDILDALVAHRFGPMAPADAIVFVAAAATHRRAAFEAADFLMDQLKTRAPFWKKEHAANGARWIEPREQDHHDLARWGQ